MDQNMHDIISISNKTGCPGICITKTGNLQWPEIKNDLFPGQIIADRPSLAAHVFRINLRALKASNIDEMVFGEVRAHVCFIEFR